MLKQIYHGWLPFYKSSSHTGKQRPLLCILPLQLKADTSPKPSTPCYYCDISNLSLPMTGLMIMFPVLFQPQITANSVIRELLWPLCQPSSGPLTVCWPGAVFSQLRYACTFGAQLRHRQRMKIWRVLQLPIEAFKSLIWSLWSHCSSAYDSLTLCFFRIPFFVRSVTHWDPLKTGDYDHFQPPPQVIWHLNLVPLFWLDPLPQLYFGLKGSFLTLTALLNACSLFDNQLGGRMYPFASHHLSMDWKHEWQW